MKQNRCPHHRAPHCSGNNFSPPGGRHGPALHPSVGPIPWTTALGPLSTRGRETQPGHPARVIPVPPVMTKAFLQNNNLQLTLSPAGPPAGGMQACLPGAPRLKSSVQRPIRLLHRMTVEGSPKPRGRRPTPKADGMLPSPSSFSPSPPTASESFLCGETAGEAGLGPRPCAHCKRASRRPAVILVAFAGTLPPPP